MNRSLLLRSAKLYRDGTFFDLASDPFERQPLQAAALTGAPAASAAKLQKALDQFKDARPAELDRASAPTGEGAPAKRRKKK